jgi:quinohemoprotein ethanol dehydrogenase
MMKLRACGHLLVAVAALSLTGALAGCKGSPSGDVQSSAEDTARYLDSSDGSDWPGYGRTYGEQHYSPLAHINDGNAATLGLAWALDFGVGNTATVPIAVGGVIYTATGLSVITAVDAATGKVKWVYDPKIGEKAGKKMRSQWGSRGLSYWNGKIYVGGADGQLIAVNAADGKEVWSVQTAPAPGDLRFITGAPRVFDGKVVIGHGGADTSNNRGYITTYDAETGKQLWRFFIVPGNPADGFEDETQEMAAKTWKGEWWKQGGGGAAWNAFAYDPDTDTIMVGTGNGAPWNQKIRSPGGGDNLFLCSLVALDAKTGKYKWHYQFNPGETWDFNAAMDMQFADLMIDGKPRKVVMEAPKNGFFYVIDRTNGKLISAEKIAKVNWAEKIDIATGRPVEVPAMRFPDGKPVTVWPAYRGAHSWMPMAFSPKSKLAYVPKIELSGIYSDEGMNLKNWKRASGNAADLGLKLGFDVKDPLQDTSSLVAWDPVTQKKAWEVKTIGGWNGGVMATGGNLVFQGQIDGRFSAYSADKGKELWHFDAQNAVLGAPISYSVKGEQYVTVMVGMGSSAGSFAASHAGLTFDYRTQKRRMLTFKLGGTGKLPPKDPPFVAKAFDDPAYKPDDKLAMQGATIIGQRCMSCHGIGLVAGGLAPDLRGSPTVMDEATFKQIVQGGILHANGMPQFEELSDVDLAAVRQYIRSRAADLRAGRK